MCHVTKPKYILDVGEEIGHDAVEEFQIINQELGHVDVTDGTQGDQLLQSGNERSYRDNIIDR